MVDEIQNIDAALLNPSQTDLQSMAKARQNWAFRNVGASVTLAGCIGLFILLFVHHSMTLSLLTITPDPKSQSSSLYPSGFAPSLYKAVETGGLWSVSHDLPHTKNTWLVPHLFGMLIWTLSIFLQLSTGGTKQTTLHKIGGYVGSTGLFLGMLFAACNELEYDSGGGLFYTLCLAVGATANMLLGVYHARGKRYPTHKDHMLMAIMYTLDPAIHRLAMWSIRWIASIEKKPLDPILLLVIGKIPANFILFTSFGAMVLYARRVNLVTVVNISFNAFWFVILSLLTFMRIGDIPMSVGLYVIAADISFLVITTGFIWVEWARRHDHAHSHQSLKA